MCVCVRVRFCCSVGYAKHLFQKGWFSSRLDLGIETTLWRTPNIHGHGVKPPGAELGNTAFAFVGKPTSRVSVTLKDRFQW